MANIKLIEEVTILDYFVCAIEYNDMTGLDDEEEILINAWVENYPSCMFEYGESIEFAKCDITGLMGNCIDVKIYKNMK